MTLTNKVGRPAPCLRPSAGRERAKSQREMADPKTERRQSADDDPDDATNGMETGDTPPRTGPEMGAEAAGESVEESLLSCETLDRSSPDLWPRQIPGLSEYVSLRSENSRDAWPAASNSKTASAADISLMQQLGTLSTSGLIIEVKKLHDLAYQLGIEEAKEMTRGKYLNIFKSRNQQ